MRPLRRGRRRGLSGRVRIISSVILLLRAVQRSLKVAKVIDAIVQGFHLLAFVRLARGLFEYVDPVVIDLM